MFAKTGTSSKPTNQQTLRELFQEHPITAFKRNNTKQIIGGNVHVSKMAKLKKSIFPLEQENALHVYRWGWGGGARTLCCNQVMATNTFTSQQAKRTFNIFFNRNCKREYVIYLLECILCKMRYVGKAETAVNLRLNNRRKGTKKLHSSLQTFSGERTLFQFQQTCQIHHH